MRTLEEYNEAMERALNRKAELVEKILAFSVECGVCSLTGMHKLSCPENPGAPVKLYL